MDKSDITASLVSRLVSEQFPQWRELAIEPVEHDEAIGALAGEIGAQAATRVWNTSLEGTWRGSPVWVHGDVVGSNLLVVDGRLSAVIDFGCCGVGDPACDLAIAWTLFFGESRAAFRARLGLDEATWARGRGWALWKGLITAHENGDEAVTVRFGWRTSAREIIDDLLAEHSRLA